MPSDQENIEELTREVARLREQVEAIARHIGLGQLEAASSGPSPAIADAIRSGNKILAIKLHREETGVGLRESKNAVEEMARQLGYY